MIGDTPMRRETMARMRDTGVAVFDFGVFRLRAGSTSRRSSRCWNPPRCSAPATRWSTATKRIRRCSPNCSHRLCELGRRYGILMNLEATPWTGVPNLASAVRVVQACGHAGARVMIDTIHVDRSNGTPADIARVSARVDRLRAGLRRIGPRPRGLRDDDLTRRATSARFRAKATSTCARCCARSRRACRSASRPPSGRSPRGSPVERACRGRSAVDSLLAAIV